MLWPSHDTTTAVLQAFPLCVSHERCIFVRVSVFVCECVPPKDPSASNISMKKVQKGELDFVHRALFDSVVSFFWSARE